MLFIETSTFTKLLPNYLTDEEYRGLQTYLSQKPDAGDLIKGSGGVRKVRWAPAGSGKSGGIRARQHSWPYAQADSGGNQKWVTGTLGQRFLMASMKSSSSRRASWLYEPMSYQSPHRLK